MTKFILDSGDPEEYKEISALAKEHNTELWGGTTNPSLIAKKLTGQKITSHKAAFDLQKEIVQEIAHIVPGAVSGEVYADEETTGEQMAEQGREIATWGERIVVKIPTTIEGFRARTLLRKENILTNNTLVFSQEQIVAICLHEQLVEKEFGPRKNAWPPFISPFIGRLDDIGQNGMDLVKNGMEIKKQFSPATWMLAASVRTIAHFSLSLAMQSELITVPAKTFKEWFALTEEQKSEIDTTYQKTLQSTPLFPIPDSLFNLTTTGEFQQAITGQKLDISHELTDKGLVRFASDWNALISA